MLGTNTSRKDILPAEKTFGPFFRVIEGDKTQKQFVWGPNGFWNLLWKVKIIFWDLCEGWKHKSLKKLCSSIEKKQWNILADLFPYYRVLQVLTNNL